MGDLVVSKSTILPKLEKNTLFILKKESKNNQANPKWGLWEMKNTYFLAT